MKRKVAKPTTIMIAIFSRHSKRLAPPRSVSDLPLLSTTPGNTNANAQQSPALTAGGKREADIATPTNEFALCSHTEITTPIAETNATVAVHKQCGDIWQLACEHLKCKL